MKKSHRESQRFLCSSLLDRSVLVPPLPRSPPVRRVHQLTSHPLRLCRQRKRTRATVKSVEASKDIFT